MTSLYIGWFFSQYISEQQQNGMNLKTVCQIWNMNGKFFQYRYILSISLYTPHLLPSLSHLFPLFLPSLSQQSHFSLYVPLTYFPLLPPSGHPSIFLLLASLNCFLLQRCTITFPDGHAEVQEAPKKFFTPIKNYSIPFFLLSSFSSCSPSWLDAWANSCKWR